MKTNEAGAVSKTDNRHRDRRLPRRGQGFWNGLRNNSNSNYNLKFQNQILDCKFWIRMNNSQNAPQHKIKILRATINSP